MDPIFSYGRWLTREVTVGDLPLGGFNPIRVQSMTNTPTLDTKATVAQAIRMIHAGSEYIRITAQNLMEAVHLSVIKEELRSSGYHTPLIADVHFSPKVALEAARRVEKIRINPGNYSSARDLKGPLSEAEYQSEWEQMAENLYPLLKVCRQYGTALRIGTNHGSLSGRIMHRFGDTPEGMVESAMEFVRICSGYGFHNLVLSMKSSNIRVGIFATRLLVCKMQEEGYAYPLHLGVTEAGDGEDGRVKSAAGIGALLEDGIGDTIRVSLTEPPENELPVARMLAGRYNRRQGPYKEKVQIPENISYFSCHRRETAWIGKLGDGQPPAVVTTCLGKVDLRCYYFNPHSQSPDYLYDPPGIEHREHPASIRQVRHILEYDLKRLDVHPLIEASSFTSLQPMYLFRPWINLGPASWKEETARIISQNPELVLVLHKQPDSSIHLLRKFFAYLDKHSCRQPVILRLSYPGEDIDQFNLYSASDAVFILCDGLIDGLWLEWEPKASCKFPTMAAYNILQSTGDRLTRTDYVACPSCGRTQFDIQQVLARVKERTSHLKGLRIAVMGCIVNGPGEMADSHYGYVGSANNKVNLYKGKTLVTRNIPETEALEALVALIKENGDWKEKPD